jgi:membrane protease YdiL (CAAX protease family)
MLVLVIRVSKVRPLVFGHSGLQSSNLKGLILFHALGIMIMLTPVLLIRPLPLFLLEFPDRINFEQLLAFLGCFGIIGLFPWNKLTNNLVEEVNVSAVHVTVYTPFRIAFLVVYEWFFRGMLLISFSKWLGISWAIGINIFLYALLHIHKSKKEIVGCVPLGLLLCFFTIWWQSIWPAIIFHVQIAIVNEWPRLKQFISTQTQSAL